MEIVSLDKQYLAEAQELVRLGFPHSGDLPQRALAATLNPELAKPHPDMTHVKERLGWVALEEGIVAGVIGLYTQYTDEAECDWVNWYCVAHHFRGRGIGSALLAHVEAEARKRKKPYLRLFTSDAPNEAAAQSVYERAGLKIYKTEDVKDADSTATLIYYREKPLL